MDPTFLLLSVMEAVKGNRFMELDQMIADVQFGWSELLRCRGLAPEKVCDVNEALGPDRPFYRLAPNKTTQWLKEKAERVAEALQRVEERDCLNASGAGACADGFFVPEKTQATPAAEAAGARRCLRTAVDIIGEYVSLRWINELKQSLGLTEASGENKFPAASDPTKSLKRETYRSRDDMDDILSYVCGSGNNGNKRTKRTEAKLTPAQKKLAKTNTKGMKSMMSFFKKR